jgi:hypothetical protein
VSVCASSDCPREDFAGHGFGARPPRHAGALGLHIKHPQTEFFASAIDMSSYVNQVLFLFEWGHICKKS